MKTRSLVSCAKNRLNRLIYLRSSYFTPIQQMTSLLDKALLRIMVDERMVTIRQHPTVPDLYILNYTDRAQYKDVWNPITTVCRGLIVRGDPLSESGSSEVVARPFPKFFNIQDHIVDPFTKSSKRTPLPDHQDTPSCYSIHSKIDGSLGILYHDGNCPAIATRGSFDSKQALWATQYMKEHIGSRQVPQGKTLLFEIVYPDNKILVDYGSQEALVLLACIDNETGLDAPLPEEWLDWHPEQLSTTIPYNIDEIRHMTSTTNNTSWQNHEGFVIHWPSTGLRVKAKFIDYMNLLKFTRGMNYNEKALIKKLIAISTKRKEWDESMLYEGVPDEFHENMAETLASIKARADEIEADCRKIVTEHQSLTLQQVAPIYRQYPNSNVLFAMHNSKDYLPLIYKTML